ncbi:hypothetical protein EST38_g359 [Candolleomyces aberdarensis]|uniref:Uncharacterized protein n=1 Tax=Candolleomyces aberdarensis TaxID=2316362 RepID=A0A4Q2E0E6_9AGAR|nr:hypothetical protein EST38_g359 [Candolleomyces aberdarensis]
MSAQNNNNNASRLNGLFQQLFGHLASLQFFVEEVPGIPPPNRQYRALVQSVGVPDPATGVSNRVNLGAGVAPLPEQARAMAITNALDYLEKQYAADIADQEIQY